MTLSHGHTVEDMLMLILLRFGMVSGPTTRSSFAEGQIWADRLVAIVTVAQQGKNSLT